ncbi:hypothetical protein HDV02_003281 [Globomyces sp. JEL0801]|nr:hypothetical protein HDV02_003281 [Globomyces sp. JEL0801]
MQDDVLTAFLLPNLKEQIYMEQPKGYAMNCSGDINTGPETEEAFTLQDQINSINRSLILLTSKINVLLEIGTTSNSLPGASIINTDPENP